MFQFVRLEFCQLFRKNYTKTTNYIIILMFYLLTYLKLKANNKCDTKMKYVHEDI